MKQKPRWLMILRDVAEIAVSIALFGLMIWAFFWLLINGAEGLKKQAPFKTDTVGAENGVGRATALCDGVLLLGRGTDAPGKNASLRVYTEGVDDPMPEWYKPDEPMAVEWKAADDFAGALDVCRNDGGCPDWNAESPIYGWGGRSMTAWELDLFSRVFMLEFWGTSQACCEAGCDAILNLWDTGLYGGTIGECLWARNDQGNYIYSVCNYLWDWNYDPDGFEWCREFCRERFVNGPVNTAVYFQLYGYHDPSWAEPLYEIDGVYFSAGR